VSVNATLLGVWTLKSLYPSSLRIVVWCRTLVLYSFLSWVIFTKPGYTSCFPIQLCRGWMRFFVCVIKNLYSFGLVYIVEGLVLRYNKIQWDFVQDTPLNALCTGGLDPKKSVSCTPAGWVLDCVLESTSSIKVNKSRFTALRGFQWAAPADLS
jgi:hypothetical protein